MSLTQNANTPRDTASFHAQSEASKQFLTFSVDSEEYGVDIMKVLEIKGWKETTRMPGSPDFMRGVINLRGLIIPIFDLRMRLRLGMTEATEKHVVIILSVGTRNIGVLVDAVSDIVDASLDQIKPAPAEVVNSDDVHVGVSSALSNVFISGLISLDNRMVVLLDVDHLFEAKQIEMAISEAV